ncbi:DUF4166 domain-containing protein [Bacillus velezensis]|uniref:DUF4166 domain-containing protein n=1 Tax=Bacillus velezensis TaxID=492670 RepID=UPI002859D8C5|nr:DUF4166 domain-containing protein [Bacillus velezensis]MDR7907041.1 DUF4166 domain-containing protein [Bacillus velezensis]
MKQKTIYVEINIASDIETLWEYTQNPHLHKEWDLRFSDITYLHRLPDEPQRFLYETRIGFGLKVSGTGESIGDIRSRSSERVSSLAFASDHPLSLIKEGRGYWKYIERDNGQTAFLTQYQYETARGLPGSWIDRFLFRPLLSWATAWSFDALRLWIEQILLSELHLEASSDGGLVITSGRQWLLIGGKKIPLSAWLCGSSTVYEAYDEEMNCFSIKVHVKNRILGTLFSYRGTFRETEGETC